MNLRDHDQPCEHGERLTHFPDGIHDDERADDPCPGGREVTIDWDSGADWWIDASRMLGYTTDWHTGRVKAQQFLAALGLASVDDGKGMAIGET